MNSRIGLAALVLLVPLAAWADPPAKPLRLDANAALGLLGQPSTDSLAGSIRGYLVKHVSPTLYETHQDWGEMKYCARGLEWHGQGLKVRPEIARAHKNHGKWRHIWVTLENPADSLIFDIRNVHAEPGRLAFEAFLSFDSRLHYHQQNWRCGKKTFDGESRARLRVKLLLACEATSRMESNGTLLPDAVVRLRVVQARLTYDNFVMEHLPGLGGEAAEILGDAFKSGLQKWDPNLERSLIARIESAIVQSADTKEVRLSVGKLLRKMPR